MVSTGDFGNVFIREFLVAAVNHCPEFAGIDEKDFVGTVAELVIGAVARQKPQASRDHGVVKKLGGQSHHAVYNAGFDHVLADISLATGVTVHAAVS